MEEVKESIEAKRGKFSGKIEKTDYFNPLKNRLMKPILFQDLKIKK
jgi:hypothetical protein